MFVKGGLVLPAESPLLLWFSESKAFSAKLACYWQSEHRLRLAGLLFPDAWVRDRTRFVCMIEVSKITLNQHAPLTLSTLWRRLTIKGLSAALTTSSPWLSSSSSLLSKSSNLSFTTCSLGNISQRVITQCVVEDLLLVTSCSGTFHVSAKK